LNIKFYYQDTAFRLRTSSYLKNWIKEVIEGKDMKPGNLFFIFVNDLKILEINREFLGHDYYTDVITFNNSETGEISGDVYLSIDTIRENALKYNQKVKEEIERVIIHAVLHLLGYDDRTSDQKKIMSRMEDIHLAELRK
jgi:rRNA maturation RNase YbeY